jgi:CDP-glycerol glycerophosphotransferase
MMGMSLADLWPRFVRMGKGPIAQFRRTIGGGTSERLTIVRDTAYRRARGRALRLAHALDDAVTRAVRRRRRILFEAASPMSFSLFQPVYRRLREDARLEVWFTAPGRAWRPEAIFSSVGITERVIPASRAVLEKWDICVNTDFWEMTKLWRRTQRIHLFHGVAGKYNLDAPVDLAPEIATFACLMFPNHDRLRRYVDAGLVADDGRTAALVGYPKLDAVVDGSLDRRTIRARLGLEPDTPVVLYAPTWSPQSSLHTMGERIIDALAAAGYQVVVKLHDRSYDLVAVASAGVDWAQRLAVYRAHPRVRVVREADASPLLVLADALVTDHSSIGFEFMLLDRPLIVVDCPELLEHAQIPPARVSQLRAAADVVGAAGDVPDAVAAGLGDPGRHSRARRETAEAMFYRAGTATDRAVTLIYDWLGLPAPVPREARHIDAALASSVS